MTYEDDFDTSAKQNKVLEDRDDYKEAFDEEIDYDEDYETVEEEQ